jgi:hypothetical protein
MTAPITRTFPLTGPITVSVRLGHGSLTLAARDDLTEATVTLSGVDAEVLDRCTVELRGTTLVVHAPRQGMGELRGAWRKDRNAIHAVVEVPTGTTTKVATATADISITGEIGTADIATGNATVDVAAVAGDLRLRYGNGQTRIGAVTGSVQLKGGRVDARFGEIGGSLVCGFGSGTLAAHLVRGDLRARAGSGSTSIDAAYGNVDLATGSGSLTVGVPDGVSIRLDVMTASGLLHSDLPVEQAPKPGSRAVTLRAQTGRGDVRLVRAPAA